MSGFSLFEVETLWKGVAEMLLVMVVACTTHFLFSPTGFVEEGNIHCRVIQNSSEDIAIIFLVLFAQAQDLEGL